MEILFIDFRWIIHIFLQALVIFYVAFIIRNWKYFKFSWNNNAFFLPVLPGIGNIYVAIIGRCSDSVIGTVSLMGNVFGFPFNLWRGRHYFYFTKDPVEANMLLRNLSVQNKGNVYNDISYLFQNSLLTIHYNKWKIRRREYLKCFKPASLKQFSLDYYNDSVDFINRQNGSTKLSYDTFTKYAFKSFFSTSVALDKEPSNMHRFGECLMEFQSDVARKMLNPLISPALWLRFHPGGQNAAKNMKEIRSVTEQILKDKVTQRDDFKSFVANTDTPALLDLMMSLKGGILSDEDIFDDIVFFSAAAADTSGHALMIMFTLIGMFPEVQKKIYDEVTGLVGKKSLLPDDVPKLFYTEAFICESLRLFPVIPILSRVLDKDVNLGDKVVPKGTNIAISIFHLQRDERYWQDPLKFDPDRFLPNNASKIQPYTFLAFSSGPRDCLGKAQAMTMLKITVASIVRSFQITSSHKTIDEFQLMSSMSLKTRHPLDCHITLRV